MRMKTPIVILHGWAKKGSDYLESKELLESEGYTVFTPDLPGFGNQKLLKPVMDIDDYVAFVLAFFKKHNIKHAILIGHSFGGRIGAKLSAHNSLYISKLILTGAPLIKEELAPHKKVISHMARVGKKILRSPFARKVVYKIIGEWDYYRLPEGLKETFKAVIQEDIAPQLPLIDVPTLVLWGGKDTFVLPRIGREIASRIPHGTYKEITDATHKLPYENPKRFAEEVLEFIKE